MSWEQLIEFGRQRAEFVREEADERLKACPNDGEPYGTGPNGELYCRYDGYRPGTIAPTGNS